MVKKVKMYCKWCKLYFDKKKTVAQMDLLSGKEYLVEVPRKTCPQCKSNLERRVVER